MTSWRSQGLQPSLDLAAHLPVLPVKCTWKPPEGVIFRCLNHLYWLLPMTSSSTSRSPWMTERLILFPRCPVTLHFNCLHPGSCVFCHDPNLKTTSDSLTWTEQTSSLFHLSWKSVASSDGSQAALQNSLTCPDGSRVLHLNSLPLKLSWLDCLALGCQSQYVLFVCLLDFAFWLSPPFMFPSTCSTQDGHFLFVGT